MEVNKFARSLLLAQAVRETKKDSNNEHKFWSAVSETSFLCPIIVDTKETESTDTVTLMSLTDEYSKIFLMAFTGWEELWKWRKSHEQQVAIFSYEDYRNIVLKDNSPYHGIVIDPFGENVVLSRAVLCNTSSTKHMLGKNTPVMLGTPREYPKAMVNKLKEFFSRTKVVDAAYLLWKVHGGNTGYLLVLDSAISSKTLFPQVGEICRPFLTDKLLDLVLADSDLGRSAVKNHKPFFVK